MKISEAIAIADRMKPNQFDMATKIKWLSKLDGMIFVEVFMTHEGSSVGSFTGYDSSDADKELLVPFPYAEDVYGFFLCAQIDNENGEMAKYNQSITQYNSAYKLFIDWYNSTHMPLPNKTAFIF